MWIPTVLWYSILTVVNTEQIRFSGFAFARLLITSMYDKKSKQLLDFVPGQKHKNSYTVIEFNCYVSAVCFITWNSVKIM